MDIENMWERLAQHQPYADQRGDGPEWAAKAAKAAKAGDAVARAVDWIEKAEGRE